MATPALNGALPIAVAPSRNCTRPVAVFGLTVAVNAIACPALAGFGAEDSVTEAAALIIWESGGELAAVSLASPAYDAVIEWEPEARVAIDKVATPLLAAAVPRGTVASKNCTFPPAVLGFNVAAKTTACPGLAGFTEDVTVMLVANFTVWFRTAEVLDAFAASPLYTAVIGC